MGECLGNDTLLAVVEGRAAEAILTRVEAHAAACDDCRRVLSDLARDVDATPRRPSGSQPPRTAPTLIDRYVIERVLGAGAMGVVYAARDPELGRTVALKLLRGWDDDGRMQARLRREAQALAQLAHPNVVAVHDVGVHVGDIFLAMEHVDGETLGRWLESPRTPREILSVFIAAGRGLAAAHAAGLVHRDFKPENVLVGRDGRVCVADFGLARPADRAEAAGNVDAMAETSLTASGVVVGTPHYMAPEQYTGGDIDARTDQFSYCVALYAALAGQRPFAGATFETLRAAVTSGALAKPPAQIPRRVRAALVRGLATRPDDRFPDMATLLAELAPPSRRWLFALPAVAAIAIAGIVVATRSNAQPCVVDEPLWDATRRAEVARALGTAGGPFGETTANSVLALGDTYARAWSAGRTAACEATRVRGDQTEAVMELRTSCLDGAARAFAAVTNQLRVADRVATERAIAAMQGLPPIAACADIDALRSAVPLPADPAMRTRVGKIRDELAHARALRDAGKYREAHTAATGLLDIVTMTEFAAIQAETYELVGELQAEMAAFSPAASLFEKAELQADIARQDRLRARVLIARLEIVGTELRDFAAARKLAEKTTAVLARLDRPDDLQAAFLEARAGVAFQDGLPADAERDLRAALAILDRIYGKQDTRRARVLRSLGGVLMAGDQRATEAGGYFDEALAIQRASYGAEHPEVALSIAGLAGRQYMQSQYADAIATYETALAMLAKTVGTRDHRYAQVLDEQASAYEWNNGIEKAIELHRRAYEISNQTLTFQHPQTQRALVGLVSALELAGNYDEAKHEAERLLKIQRTTLPAGHVDLAHTLHVLAILEISTKHHANALAHADEAIAIARKTDPKRRIYAEQLTAGQALLALGRAGEAADRLEEAVRVLSPDEDPRQAAWIRSWLGRALVESKRDRARGLQLVRDAWTVIAPEEQMDHERASLAPWMKAHGLSTGSATVPTSVR